MKTLSMFVLMIGIMVFATGCFGSPREEGDDSDKNGDGQADAGTKPVAGQECVIEFTAPPTFAVSTVNVKGMSGSEITTDGKIVGAYSVLGDCKVAKDEPVECKLDKLEENAMVMDVNLEVIANGQVFYACYSDGHDLLDFGSFMLKCGEIKYKMVKVANGANGCNYRVVFYGSVENPDGGTPATDAGTVTDAGGTTTDAGTTTTDAGTIDPGTQYVGNFVANCVPPAGYATCTMYVGYGSVLNGTQSDKEDMAAVSGKAILANALCHSWWTPDAAIFALKAIRADGSSSWVRNPDGNVVLLDPRGTRVPLRQLSKAENVGTGLLVDIPYCRNPAY